MRLCVIDGNCLRGAIKRHSLRDKSGMTLARLEAQKEHRELIRSWSKEDVSTKTDDTVKKSAVKGTSKVCLLGETGLWC